MDKFDRLKHDYYDRKIVQLTLDYFLRLEGFLDLEDRGPLIGSTTSLNVSPAGSNRHSKESPALRSNCSINHAGTVDRKLPDVVVARDKAVTVPLSISTPNRDNEIDRYKVTYPVTVTVIYPLTYIGNRYGNSGDKRCINMTVRNPRQLRALAILSSGKEAIKRLKKTVYIVKSQHGEHYYSVIKKKIIGWTCDCPNWRQYQNDCKHIYAVQFSMQLRLDVEREVKPTQIIEASNSIECPSCKGNHVVKSGLRKCKKGTNQRYECKNCSHRFVIDIELSRLKGTPEAVSISMDLYFKGVSLAKIKHHLKMFYKMDVNRSTIMRWIHKFSELLNDYAEKYKPKVGDLWNTDEMTCGIREKGKKGRKHWIWNLMDSDTRFLLASQISRHREVEDARKPLRLAKKRAGKKPRAMITDGLQSYPEAIRKEMYSRTDPTIHFRTPSDRKRFLNQNIERLNGTTRERLKVMRGYGGDETAQVLEDGKRFYYNFIRPHMSLNGSTPAMMAQIPHVPVESDPWLTHIRLALREKKS